MINILAISGSLRQASSNFTLIKATALLAPVTMQVNIYEGIGALPFFTPDLTGNEPPVVMDLKTQLAAADGLLICSPEYAHGVPGVMKNALDWLVSGMEIVDKPVALLNASPRSVYAQASLKETITTMSGRVIEEASLDIPLSGKKLDEAGMMADTEIAGLIKQALAKLIFAIENPPVKEY